MAERVVIFQSDPKAAKILDDYFWRRGDVVSPISDLAKAQASLVNSLPTIALIDLHSPGHLWLDLITLYRQKSPDTTIILTNKRPDVRREFIAKDLGINIFLREPFSPAWIENALSKVGKGRPITRSPIPRVRIPMRVKITFPYTLLALLFVFAAAFLVSRYILESMRDRFVNSLIETGKLSTDAMVQEENRLLNSLRLITHTKGMADAIQASDANELYALCLPVAVNYHEEALLILDSQGVSRLSLFHHPGGTPGDYASPTQGDTTYAGLEFVQKVLAMQVDQEGDKYAEMVEMPDGNYFMVSGPIFNAEGVVAGVVLVGKSMDTLVREIRQKTFGQISIYQADGQPVVSTIFVQSTLYPITPELSTQVLQEHDEKSNIRPFTVASVRYSEVLSSWGARNDHILGILGVALAEDFVSRARNITNLQMVVVVAFAFVCTIILGLFLANQITRPLSRIVKASSQVARGNLDVKVPSGGNDEVAVLASAFNYMVSGLQEGFIYRELLGKTVSPEVRETLRHSFASGDLRLEGQSAIATVLMSDIRGFTQLSEKVEPITLLKWLNEYFSELVPVIDSHGGVVDKFEGDAMLTFFGILPTPLPADESARQACQAALEMLDVLDRLNAVRKRRGEPILLTGIGVSTGTLTAGGLGTADRLNYTIIGDTVNTAQRIQQVTTSFGESGIVVSENTLKHLGDLRNEFNFEPIGEHVLRGKEESLWLYRLHPVDYNGKGV
jgi:class 3 adenylate cyclase/HAMP domain-containing protein/ActR/RegA family two-component response regulator